MQFQNRNDAGKKLAEQSPQVDVVIAIPRGGIPIAEPICKHHNAKLMLAFPRKLRSPTNKECAIGAINQYSDIVLNEPLCKRLKIPDDYIEMEKNIQIHEISERKQNYASLDISIADKSVIIVDDGIATGYTMLAAIKEILHQKPKHITVGIPVCASDTLQKIREICDVICLYDTANFGAVGYYYEDFHQVETSEAKRILERINHNK